MTRPAAPTAFAGPQPPPGAGGPPAPPAGPGVQPPFATAPVEGRTARIWLGLGVAGAVLAVCCGAGGVALGGFFIAGVQALNEQADRVVGDYLEAVVESDWAAAYELRCAEDKEQESEAEFAARLADLPPVESYELGELDLTASNLALPAELTFADGQTESVAVPLNQNTGTGDLEVCGFEY